MQIGRQGFFERRGAAALVFGLFVAGGLVFVFAGTLAKSTDLEAQAAQDRAEIAALEARVAAGWEEVEFLKTDAFIEQQARAVNFGTKSEQGYRLPAGAPPAPAITPIGSSADDATVASPFDAWMKLLFGA